MRGVWINVVQGRGFLHNGLARWVQDFHRGSSRLVKKMFKMCPFNSELHPWAASQSSYNNTEDCLPSTRKYLSKSPSDNPGHYIYCSGKHSLLKLGSSKQSANRHYSTALSSGNGTRKKRKETAKSPNASVVSDKLLHEKQSNDCMKEGETPISSTTSPNAMDSTGETNGRPGVFYSLRNLEKSAGKYRKIIHLIADVDMLKYAYTLIKSKPGNLTPGGDDETLDGISQQ